MTLITPLILFVIGKYSTLKLKLMQIIKFSPPKKVTF